MEQRKRYRVIESAGQQAAFFENALNEAADEGYEIKFVVSGSEGIHPDGFSVQTWAIMEHPTPGIGWKTYDD